MNIRHLTDAVLTENEEQIKEAMAKGIASMLENYPNDYFSAVKEQYKKIVNEWVEENLKEELIAKLNKIKPELLKGVEAGLQASALHVGEVFLQTIVKKTESSWSREQLVKQIFEGN
jgi:hypothetical protein